MPNSPICPNCQSNKMEIFHQTEQVPTNSCILLSSKDEAINYPKGNIALGFCSNCGFISNTLFNNELTEYSGRYEETQGFSTTFNEFHKQLANNILKDYQLQNKDILEIGCGKGEFLMLLCENNKNRGIGFDPSYLPERNKESNQANVTFITDFYSESYSKYKADFICCKMTLEHIYKTGQFVETIRNAIKKNHDTTVFFMIPETTRILKDCAFEDIYYEHCSYFTPFSLAYLFEKSGFNVININNLYDGQYLTITAKPASRLTSNTHFYPQNKLKHINKLVSDFPILFENKKRYWINLINDHFNAGRKIIIWGSGSKGVSFLTTLGIHKEINYVVDINPNRHEHFMPSTGQKIVGPEFLDYYRPDTIIVMNPIYKKEISEELEKRKLKPELITL